MQVRIWQSTYIFQKSTSHASLDTDSSNLDDASQRNDDSIVASSAVQVDNSKQ